MTLSFSQKFPDKSFTYFIDKIWQGLINKEKDKQDDLICVSELMYYSDLHKQKFSKTWHEIISDDYLPKIHTIREDKKNRWKVGSDIHFVINNRTKNRFQFAPILKVKKVDFLKIIYNEHHNSVTVRVNDKIFGICSWNPDGTIWNCHPDIIKLAVNDGFPSVEKFFKWFSSDFEGKIIHWTDFSY